MFTFRHFALQGQSQCHRAGNIALLVEHGRAAGADPTVVGAFHQNIALPLLILFHPQRTGVREHGDEIEILRDGMGGVTAAQRPVGGRVHLLSGGIDNDAGSERDAQLFRQRFQTAQRGGIQQPEHIAAAFDETQQLGNFSLE